MRKWGGMYSPRERVEAVLHGAAVDHVPFTVYECMIPQCRVERQLRDEGLCIVNRRYAGYETATPNCRTESHTYTDPDTGKTLVRSVTHTPVGDLTSVSEPAGFTSWRHELPFKGPEDYAKLIFVAKDTTFRPAYDMVLRAREWLGEDVHLRGGMPGYSPLQAIIYSYLGVETFAQEWAERRDEVLRLYEALHECSRRCYRIVAESPHEVIQYGGNVSPEIVGRQRFADYILPHYEELAEELHRRGKMLLVHLDANCGLLADLIGGSGIDIIEAFTPAPDTDMTLAEARQAWPDKVLWINFPSSVHLADEATIWQTTRNLVEAGGHPLLIGITEDVPEDRWQQSFLAISRGVRGAGLDF